MYGKYVAAIAAVTAICLQGATAQDVDQEQPQIDRSEDARGVGVYSDQRVAQTFTVGTSGVMLAVDLPLSCTNETPTFKITGVASDGKPDDADVRREFVVDRDVIPVAADGFKRIYLQPQLVVTAGDRLAFALSLDGPNSCGIESAPAGDLYPRGNAFFESTDNPPGWTAFKGLDPYADLPFRTIMRGADGGPSTDRCDAVDASGNPVAIPSFIPACRCFEDDALLNLHCGGLFRDFVIWRSLPMSPVPGKPYEEVWTFSPVRPLQTPVELYVTNPETGKVNMVKLPAASKPLEWEEFRFMQMSGPNGQYASSPTIVYGKSQVGIRLPQPQMSMRLDKIDRNDVNLPAKLKDMPLRSAPQKIK